MAAEAGLKPSPTDDSVHMGRYADYLAAGLQTLAFGSKGDRTKYRLKIAAARALEEIGRTTHFDGQDAAWLALTLETERLISMLRTVTA